MTSVVSDLFRLQSHRAGGSPAITFNGRTLTRADLEGLTRSMATSVEESVNQLPGTLAIALQSPFDVFAGLHAALALDLGAVLCDPEWDRATRQKALERVGATHGLTAEPDEQTSVSAFDTFCASPSENRNPVGSCEVVFFTSGTTGTPSAIVHSDRTIASALWLLVAGNDLVAQPAKDLAPVDALIAAIAGSPAEAFESGPVLVSCLPPWTHAGFTMMNYATLTGSHLQVAWPFDPERALGLIESGSASSIGLSPFMAQLLLRTQRRLRRDVGSLVVIGLGAGPVSAQLAEELEETFGCVVSIGYGLTETGGAVMRSRWGDPPEVRTATVGFPLPGAEFSLGALGDAQADGEGELLVRTPAMMEATISAEGRRVPFAADRWFHTGDVARITPDGAVQIVRRLSEVIIRGGRNIDPKRIEAVIATHAAVRECAVIGRDSRVAGEQEIWAAIVLEDGKVLEPRELTRLCRGCLASYEVPTRVRFVASIPRTSDGGIQRFKLAQGLGPS